MAKDRRYNTVKNLISGGFIKEFNQIFETLPKSVLAKDLKFNSTRMNTVVTDCGRFFVKDLSNIALLIEVDELEIMKLIAAQNAANKKGKRKK